MEDEAPAVQWDWIGSIVVHRQKPGLGGSRSHFLAPEVDGGQWPGGEFGKAGPIIIAPWCQKDRLGAMGWSESQADVAALGDRGDVELVKFLMMKNKKMYHKLFLNRLIMLSLIENRIRKISTN